jgi:hypothetical protein
MTVVLRDMKEVGSIVQGADLPISAGGKAILQILSGPNVYLWNDSKDLSSVRLDFILGTLNYRNPRWLGQKRDSLERIVKNTSYSPSDARH